MTAWLKVAIPFALLGAGCATPQTERPAIAASAVAEEAVAQQRFMIEQRIA